MALFQLSDIYFKKVSTPAGTFAVGDTCYIYYDSDTKTIKAYKNGVQITSGDNIQYPLPIANGTEKLYQVLVCSGSDRLQFTRTNSFPYYSIGYLYNHPSCDIGNVCDLRFNTIADVVNASGQFNSDGSITVSATSSNTGIQYKLNEDFVYGFGQTSGLFSNLNPGLYVVYARDSKNCRAVQTVRVGISYSYGVKYRFEFPSKDGKTHKTEILEKDYSGAITDVEGSLNPVVYRLRGEGNQEKFNTITPSEIEMQIISQTEGQFADLSTSDSEKYRIKHTIDGSVKWIGKVLVNQYSEDYISPPYPISIIASDSLPTLIDIPFLDDNNLPFNGVFKQIDVIAFILAKLNLGINIRSAVNLYATSMAKTTADDPLDQSYIDLSRYYIAQSEPTCAQVLGWILEPYTASIIQWENKWFIYRIEERVNDFKYREYDVNGNYVSNGTYTPLIDLKNSSYSNRMVWANRNQKIRILPGYGSVRLIHDLGNKYNILENGDFRLRSSYKYEFFTPYVGVAPDLSGFEIVNNSPGSGIMIDYEKFDNDGIAVLFDSWLSKGVNYLNSKTYNLKTGNLDKLKFKYRFKIQRSYWKSEPTLGYVPYYVRVKLLVNYGDYFLRSDGNWTTVSNTITIIVGPDDYNKFIDYEIICNQPDSTYIDGANFNVKLFFPDPNEAEFQAATTADAIVALKNLATITNFGYAKIPVGFQTEVYDNSGSYFNAYYTKGLLYYELQEDTNAESLPYIVRPNDYNATTNPVQWILQGYKLENPDIVTSLAIDLVSVEVISDNKSLANNESLEKFMENNNGSAIGKTILHGSLVNNSQSLITAIRKDFFWNDGIEITLSNNNGFNITSAQWYRIYLFSANCADIAYSGYLRNSSGTGYTTWERSNYEESKTLQEIFLDSYASQYNKSYRMLFGDMYSDDTFFGPLNTLKETIDNNTLYVPMSLEIDFYNNLYNAEFVELFDITENSPAGFTKGFTKGFNS